MKNKLTISELRVQLGKCLMSQDKGPKFSQRLENKIASLKRRIAACKE